MLTILTSRVYLDAESGPLEGRAILVDGERIVDVVNADATTAVAAEGVLDWRGLTVVPGFVDAHLHVTTRGAGKLHEEMDEDVERALEIGRANLSSAVGWGVTTVRDAGSWNGAVLALRDETAHGTFVGPRVLPAGAPLTTTRGHLYWFGGEANGPAAVREFVARQSERGMTHVKVMATGGWATPGSDPRLPQFSVAELAAAADEARRLGMQTMAHISATEGVRRGLDAGIDTLEHAMFQNSAGEWEYPADLIEQIVRQRAWIDPTPAWHYRTVQSPPPGMSDERLTALREARAARMKAYRLMLEQGHDRWLTGTDTGGTNPRDYFPLVCEIMVREIGLTPRQVLRAATLGGAEALGLSRHVGALRPGMAADIVAFDGDPIRDELAFWKVREVMARGRVVEPMPDHSKLDESVGGGWE